MVKGTSTGGVWAGVLLMRGQFERVGLLLSSLFATNIDLFFKSWQCGTLGIGNTKKPKWRLFMNGTSQSALAR